MSLLPRAPLLEAIFIINWGKLPEGVVFPKLSVNGIQPISLNYTQDHAVIFSGKFAAEIAKKDFTEIQSAPIANPFMGPVPQMRFNKPGNSSSIYQIGMGLFSIHQLNEGYEWNAFRNLILDGTDAFVKAVPGGLETTDIVSMELRYRDGLLFEEGETALDFLQNKMLVKLVAPDRLFSFPGLDDKVMASRVNFGIACENPDGIYVLDLMQGETSEGKGYILDTVVKSSINEKISLEPTFLEKWLNDAHLLQKHSFENVINKAHAEKAFQGT